MRYFDYEDIGEIGKDVIKEIGSIGTGNAATAVSSILGTNVKIELPDIKILPFGDAISALGDPEEPVIAVLASMSGDMNGIMLFLLRLEFANDITNAMMGKTNETYNDIDEISESAITEIGNIIISSYVNALSGFTGMSSQLSVPSMAINMLGGILNVPMAEIGYESDKIMLIAGNFILGNNEHNSSLLMLPKIDALEMMITKLIGDFN